MKHVFEFQLKYAGQEEMLQSHIVTDSNRMSKVAKTILQKVNKMRELVELPTIKQEEIESFKLRRLR